MQRGDAPIAAVFQLRRPQVRQCGELLLTSMVHRTALHMFTTLGGGSSADMVGQTQD
jgi:hypothetical protein